MKIMITKNIDKINVCDIKQICIFWKHENDLLLPK